MEIPHYQKKRSFLEEFSDEDLLLSGWAREEMDTMLGVFETIMLFVQSGNYLELGCGTGILGAFIHLFSGKEVIPYGIDINLKAIESAKKNNPQFANNFILADYFDYLKRASFFERFSTINIFLSGAENWRRAREDLLTIADHNNQIILLICDYDTDLIVTKQTEILRSISEFSKKYSTTVVNGSTLIVGGDPEMNKVAKEMLRVIKEQPDCVARKDYAKLFTTGVIVSKTSNQICIMSAQQSRESFGLNANTRFSAIRRMKSNLDIEWVARDKDIIVGDKVEIMFYTDQINIAVGVKKLF
jgi:SAM-dependent methyltransferase